jgi:hypothetical protein
VLYYYLGDHVLYLAYKMGRRDLYHWVPLEGAAMVAETAMMRVGVKAITDFTGVVQFRGPAEMGGAAWTFSQGSALVASFVATHIYLSSDEGVADEEAIGESFVWKIVGALSGSQVIFFICFLLLMKRNFWGTFFSTQTGYQYVQSKFLREGDENKKAVFKYNKKLWLGIREDVKAWTLENWERWEEEKPEWFGGDAWKAQIDDDMIPSASLRELNGGGSQRRRSSLGDIFNGGGGRA